MKKLLKKLREDIDECKFHGAYEGDNYECVSEAIATLDKLEEAINYTHCSIQLLCVNEEDDNSITKGYEYKCIEKDKTHYKIIDNYSYEGWFPKKLFKELK